MHDVTKQVVAGMSYTIYGVFQNQNKEQFECEINLWERAWLADTPEGLIVTVKSKKKYVEKPNGAQGSLIHEMKFEFDDENISAANIHKNALLFTVVATLIFFV